MGEVLLIGNPHPWPLFYLSGDGDRNEDDFGGGDGDGDGKAFPSLAPPRPVVIPTVELM
ncbi:hypothetical protein TIFTF001_025303 [Ficus carica]|uniref:Uncharacterized protein n=1 Tax=Ficus carica TaxID=3494 RepID=A0AA88DE20_FICCA|nr:hypothetical protein TIFTF001_025303 [Ficus carica]